MMQHAENVRASGLHPLGDALGLRWGHCAGGKATVRLADAALLDDPDASLLKVSVAADIAASSSARTLVAEGARIATTSLMMSLPRPPANGEVTATAQLHQTELVPPCAFAACVMVADEHGLCASVLGAGRVIRLERPLPPLPWQEFGESNASRETVPAPAGHVAEWMLNGVQPVDGRATIRVCELTRNRVGHLQGGATIAVADAIARTLLARDDARLRTATWSFRAPIQAAEYTSTVAYGRRSAHVWVQAHEKGRICGAGTLEYDWSDT